MSHDHGEKTHADKLEPNSVRQPDQQPSAGQPPALPDDLKAVDLDPQKESLKVHGDKLDLHPSSRE